MGKITTKKRILFSFRGQVTINGQIMSEKPGIFCAQNGQKLWVFGQPEGAVIKIIAEENDFYQIVFEGQDGNEDLTGYVKKNIDLS